MANENEQQTEPTKNLQAARDARAKRRHERLKKLNQARATKRVRVLPRDESVRRDIRHQPDGLKFPAGGGSVEWPLDQFTKRRLRDGTVTLEGAEETKARQEERQKYSSASSRRETTTSTR